MDITKTPTTHNLLNINFCLIEIKVKPGQKFTKKTLGCGGFSNIHIGITTTPTT